MHDKVVIHDKDVFHENVVLYEKITRGFVICKCYNPKNASWELSWKELSLCHKLKFIIVISLEPDDVKTFKISNFDYLI